MAGKGKGWRLAHQPLVSFSVVVLFSSLPIIGFLLILYSNSNSNPFIRITISPKQSIDPPRPPPSPPPSPPPPQPPSPPPPLPRSPPPPTRAHASSESPRDVASTTKDCDMSKGRWIPDRNASLYASSSCQTIPDSKNCFKHGREDRDFLFWRWKPNGCQLARFDAHKFLRVLTGKRLVFVGDSVARNQFESLLCLSSQAETPIDVYKDYEDRFRTWFFPRSNFTLMTFWTQFLIKHDEIIVNGSNTGVFKLHLDKVDDGWATKLSNIDYAIISTSHWFFRRNYLYDRDNLVGCVYCNEPNVTDLGLNYSIRMAVRMALKHINSCKECKDMMTIFRTFSPSHFENGAWNTGGGCNRTRPYGPQEVGKRRSFELELRELQVEELESARKGGEAGERKFISLDITEAMLMRPDGHPDAHWGNKWMKGYNDCTHWCLPGPVDVWNDILMEVILNEERL